MIIKKYIDEIRNKDFIKFNISFYAISIFIVKKFDENFRICIDYHALNVLIIKNRNVLSLIREILIKLSHAKIYIKLDVIAIFNEIKIKENYEKRIIFFIRYKFFEYVIILFDLYNAFDIF